MNAQQILSLCLCAYCPVAIVFFVLIMCALILGKRADTWGKPIRR